MGSNSSHVPGRRQRLTTGWTLVTDPGNDGIAAGWAAAPPEGGVEAFVPGALQQSAPGYHGVVWYFLRFEAHVALDDAHRALVRFEAADYVAEVWLDGVRIGAHEGGEAPFELDATAVLAASDGEHLLSVRVVNPGVEPVDGMTIGLVPHGIKSDPYLVGLGWNTGGLTGAVELIAVPRPGLGDVVVRPSASGEVAVEVDVLAPGAPDGLRLDVTIAPDAAGSGAVEQRASQAAGAGTHALSLTLDEPRDWSPEDPFLYRVTVSLADGERLLDQRTVRTGFRDFHVGADGWFRLNGKRIWLRMSHTTNHFPIGQRLPHEIDLARRDMVYAKAAGFNCVRFMGTAHPEQLDVADEIGLLVFEESFADWGGLLQDSPQMAERMDRVVHEMIVRDRNHPSIVMWGLLNEVKDDHGFRHAVSMLPGVRELDPTRVVMLASGRHDGVIGIGSLANPGSVEWEHLWGAEAPGAEPVPGIDLHMDDIDHDRILQRGVTVSYVPGAGDVHLYLRVPYDRHAIETVRGIGQHGAKPVMLSEFGTGSVLNVSRVLRRFEQAGAREDLEDFAFYRRLGEQLDRDWERYGLGEVFPAPEDLARRSEELHAVRRRRDFDLIRSNPRLCGYGLTGLVDQVMAAEGVWTTWRELKPGALTAVSEGFAPVRWCVLPSREHVAVGERFTLELVLANDGALAPGSYPATVMVHGPGGAAWREDVEVRVPEPGPDGLGPLVVPVLEREIAVDGPPGRYTIAATMTRGGAPAAGRAALWVSEPARLAAPVAVRTLGCSAALRERLAQIGCELREDLADAPAVVVVGDDSSAIDDVAWAALLDAVESGSVAVVLDPSVLRRGEEPLARLRVARPGHLERPHNWLYHREDVAKAHPVFEGLQAGGVLEWEHWGQVIPDYLFADQEADEVYAVGVFPGDAIFAESGYSSGVSLALHRLGAGALLLSTFRILPELGAEPAAERMLANLVAHAATQRSRDAA